jgi:hypothetical protein
MQVITTLGLDIAKSVFQVHGVDAADDGATAAKSCDTMHAGLGPINVRCYSNSDLIVLLFGAAK